MPGEGWAETMGFPGLTQEFPTNSSLQKGLVGSTEVHPIITARLFEIFRCQSAELISDAEEEIACGAYAPLHFFLAGDCEDSACLLSSQRDFAALPRVSFAQKQ